MIALMKTNSLVSGIIPVYNVKSYLCDSVDNLLGQIIIVDEGSNDGVSEI